MFARFLVRDGEQLTFARTGRELWVAVRGMPADTALPPADTAHDTALQARD